MKSVTCLLLALSTIKRVVVVGFPPFDMSTFDALKDADIFTSPREHGEYTCAHEQLSKSETFFNS